MERLTKQRTERIRSQKESTVPKQNPSANSSTQRPAEEKKSVTEERKPMEEKKFESKGRNPDRRPPWKSASGKLKFYNCFKFSQISQNCPDARR